MSNSNTNKQTINSNQFNINSNSNYNPDFHNIYEDTLTNLRISLDNKNEGKINQENLNNLKVSIASDGLASTKQNEAKKIYFPETEEIKTESNKICITSLHLNFTDNENIKNNFVEKYETENNIIDKNNNNNYNLKEKSENLKDVNDNYAENISMPEYQYLPTEINYNIITSTQDDKNSNQDTDNNYANNIIPTDNLQENENENDEYRYGDCVLNTEFEDMRVSVSIKRNNNNINNNSKNNDAFENLNTYESSFEPLHINDLNSSTIKKNTRNNMNSMDKTPYNNLINTVRHNNNTMVKKNVNFNLGLKNNNNNNDGNKLTKIEQNNYYDNFLNTETSTKTTTIKTKKDYSLGKNNNIKEVYKSNQNQSPNLIKNQYNNFIKNIDITKTNKFKRGFFNTSVTYEKNNDIRNKTFDGKFGSSSKSKEKPMVSNNRKTNLNTYREKMSSNNNHVNLYLTGYKENLRKINLNILNTDYSRVDNSDNLTPNNKRLNINKNLITENSTTSRYAKIL